MSEGHELPWPFKKFVAQGSFFRPNLKRKEKLFFVNIRKKVKLCFQNVLMAELFHNKN